MQPDIELWGPWEPWTLAERLRSLDDPWYIAAGWALDLFRGRQTREHDDLELAIPHDRFGALLPLFPEIEFWIPQGEKELAPMTEETLMGDSHQTWAWEPAAQRWRFDVFREPRGDDDTWIYRRDERIRLPYSRIIERTPDGVPYLVPEVVLLFKAKHARDKDRVDFAGVLPLLTDTQRKWLDDALAIVHPDHEWRSALG